MNNKRIGKFLKELRLKNNYSQTELSELIYVTRQAISNWENGKATPDSEILIKLSELYNVSIDEILVGELSGESLQKFTLNLLDNNNKQRSKIKKLLLTLLLSFIIFVIGFLAYYFVSTYNSTQIYLLYGKSKSHVIHDGILIRTNQKIYIKMGEINKDDFDNVSLYYINEKKKKIVIYKGENIDSLIIENYKYSDMFKKKLKYIKNNLYLDLQIKENKETMKIKVRENFKSSVLFNDKRPTNKEVQSTKDTKEIENVTEEKEIPTITTDVQNIKNIKEEDSTSTIKKNNPDITQNPVEEEIDYEKIKTLIKEKGTFQFNSYQVSFEQECKEIFLHVVGENIMIESVKNNEIETWKTNVANNEIDYIDYIKYKSGTEENKKLIYVNDIHEDEKEIVQKMKEILRKYLRGNL